MNKTTHDTSAIQDVRTVKDFYNYLAMLFEDSRTHHSRRQIREGWWELEGKYQH